MENSGIFLIAPGAEAMANGSTLCSFGPHRIGRDGSPGVWAAQGLHIFLPRNQYAIPLFNHTRGGTDAIITWLWTSMT